MIDYDPHDWDSHLFDIRGSMVREILGRVMTCVAWSAVVVLLYQFPFLKWIAIPSILHSLVGLALGLLLVFRTTAAYDRYWEGRKLWGSITNESRNLARGASVLLAANPARVNSILLYAQIFPFAVMARLCNLAHFGPPGSRIPKSEVEEALKSPSPPLYFARRITQILAQSRDEKLISSYEFVNIDNNVQLLIDYYGGCERIHLTPLPFPYMVHLRRALILYCFTLPFALVREFNWGTILDTLIIAYIFFGIEEIGVEIGDPFGHDDNDLPLEDFCRGIERGLQAFMIIDPDAEPETSPRPQAPPTPELDPIPIDGA